MSRFIWQCITYRNSEFRIEDNVIRPVLVLGYSDIKRIENNENYQSQWMGMIRVAGLANVGMFDEFPASRKDMFGGWRIRISSSTYFSYSRGKYKKHGEYNVYKHNIGNC